LKLKSIFNYDILPAATPPPEAFEAHMLRLDEPLEAAAADDHEGRGAATPVRLDELPHGVAARVLRMEGTGPVAKRLMEMGIVPGAPVSVVRAAPLGDPIEVRVRNYHLALRRTEARTVTVMSDKSC
jgi:ferrous iron transport protein A